MSGIKKLITFTLIQKKITVMEEATMRGWEHPLENKCDKGMHDIQASIKSKSTSSEIIEGHDNLPW